MNRQTNKIKPGDIWRHYKNKEYRILAISRHSEDLTWYVVYEALYDNSISTIWHRPLDIFLSSVEIDGKIMPRFVHVEKE